jgi:predicted esterase
MSAKVEIRLVRTAIHGRVLVREAAKPHGLLVGYHGYMENAETQMARLEAIPGSDAWTLLSIMGLHRFYKPRTEEVVASWMTSQDREHMIEDNIEYVDEAIETVVGGAPRIVHAGFSQGVAMAFRAGVVGRFSGHGIIAAGGDVPPDLLADATLQFPRVLFARGNKDDWYRAAKFDDNVSALGARAASLTPLAFDGAHEWSAAVSAAAGEFLRSIP